MYTTASLGPVPPPTVAGLRGPDGASTLLNPSHIAAALTNRTMPIIEPSVSDIPPLWPRGRTLPCRGTRCVRGAASAAAVPCVPNGGDGNDGTGGNGAGAGADVEVALLHRESAACCAAGSGRPATIPYVLDTLATKPRLGRRPRSERLGVRRTVIGP